MYHKQRQSCPVFLSVFAWSLTVLLIVSCLDITDARELSGHRVEKRSFINQCKGNFVSSIYARLNRICDDCYNMYRDPRLYTLCMENCFTSLYFKGCVEDLYLEDELPEIQKSIMTLHGAEIPGYH